MTVESEAVPVQMFGTLGPCVPLFAVSPLRRLFQIGHSIASGDATPQTVMSAPARAWHACVSLASLHGLSTL